MTTNAEVVVKSLQDELKTIEEDIAFFKLFGYAELEGQALTRQAELKAYIAGLNKLTHSPTTSTSSPLPYSPVPARK